MDPFPSSSIDTRLPILPLPSFDGSTDWRQFWSRFVVTIDCQPISNTEKLIYLLNSLHGPALDLVQGYAVSDAAYTDVKTTLEDEYGDCGMQISRLYTSFYNLDKAEETTASAHRTLQHITRITRQLISMGEMIDNGMMEVVLLKKLPHFLLECALRVKMEKRLNVTGLLENLSQEMVILRQAEELSSPSLPSSTVASTPSVRSPSVPSSTIHSARIQKRGWKTRPVYSCKFCDGAHSVLLCPLDHSHRRKSVMERKLCIACLRPSHLSSSCPSKQPCRYCSSPHHHSALCSTSSLEEKKPTCKESAARSITDEKEVILLSHDLQLINPRSGVEMRSSVFFDNGAQKSFIHEDLARSLHLIPIDHTQLDISAFGNHSMSFPSSRYIVQLRQEDGQLVDLLVHSTPRLEMEMTMTGVSPRDHDKPKPTLRTVSPGILIGSDRFWDFIHGRGPILPSGLRSIDTVFGRMITGSTSPSPSSHPLTHLSPPGGSFSLSNDRR